MSSWAIKLRNFANNLAFPKQASSPYLKTNKIFQNAKHKGKCKVKNSFCFLALHVSLRLLLNKNNAIDYEEAIIALTCHIGDCLLYDAKFEGQPRSRSLEQKGFDTMYYTKKS